MIESTEDDLDQFEAEFSMWAEKLALNDWDIKFAIRDLENVEAQCSYDTETRKALVKLAKKREGLQALSECAKHEALELLLADICCYHSSLFAERIVNTEAHRVINRLMTALKL